MLCQRTRVNHRRATTPQCALENLAVVAAETGGEVTRVDPGWTQLAGEFSSVLSNPVLATGCFAVVLLHRGLRFRGELDDEEDPTRNWWTHVCFTPSASVNPPPPWPSHPKHTNTPRLVRDIGNVTAATEACFSYGFRPKDQCDLQAHRDVPFQVQVTYNKPGGPAVHSCPSCLCFFSPNFSGISHRHGI